MSFCVNCGTKLEDGMRFCPKCGTPAAGVPAAEKSNVSFQEPVRNAAPVQRPVKGMQTAEQMTRFLRGTGVLSDREIKGLQDTLGVIANNLAPDEAVEFITRTTIGINYEVLAATNYGLLLAPPEQKDKEYKTLGKMLKDVPFQNGVYRIDYNDIFGLDFQNTRTRVNVTRGLDMQTGYGKITFHMKSEHIDLLYNGLYKAISKYGDLVI